MSDNRKKVSYLRALEIDQVKRGFFLWWNQRYVTKANTAPSPTVKTVIDDLNSERKDWGIAVFSALKLSGRINVLYPSKDILHKEIKFQAGKQVAYKVYGPKNRYGKQSVIAEKKERTEKAGTL